MTDTIPDPADYNSIHGDIVALLEAAHRAAARSVNALMTATYREIGRRIVKFEQGGLDRAAYGQALLKGLSLSIVPAQAGIQSAVEKAGYPFSRV